MNSAEGGREGGREGGDVPVFTRQGVLQPHGQAAGVHKVNGRVPLIFNQESHALHSSGDEEGTRVVSALKGRREGGREGGKDEVN